MVEEAKTFMVEGADLIFKNFSGEKGPYNDQGKRSFACKLDEKTAQEMLADGWNVKWPKDREGIDPEEQDKSPYIPIEVKFKVRPPRIIMITSKGRTTLTDDTVGILDWADMANVDLIGREYNWELNGKTGKKAYLQSMYVTINEDALALKYAEVPEGQ